EIHVIFGLEAKFGLVTPRRDDDVLFLARAVGDGAVRRIRDPQALLVGLRLERRLLLFALLDVLRKLPELVAKLGEGLGLLVLNGRHLFVARVSLGAQTVELALHGLALGVDGEEGIEKRPGAGAAAQDTRFNLCIF